MRCAVFDFDGVLGHTMELHADAYRDTLAPLGIDVTRMDIFEREGARSETIIADLLARAGREHDATEVKALAETKQRRYRELGAPRLYPEAAAMLDAVQARGPTAVVTGTRLDNLRSVLGPRTNRFKALITAGTYAHDKPHPEPYAQAATRLGTHPGDCIALENAVHGIHSAHAAGYGMVIAITTTRTAADLAAAGPDAIVGDHEAATHVLLEWLGEGS